MPDQPTSAFEVVQRIADAALADIQAGFAARGMKLSRNDRGMIRTGAETGAVMALRLIAQATQTKKDEARPDGG